MTEWTDWHEHHKTKILLVPGIDCWIWVAGRTAQKSHGRVRFTNENGDRYSEYAHRAAYISFFGKPSEGTFICHKCGVGLCVRPSHLYAGTAATNGKDTADMRMGKKAKLTYQQAYEIRCSYQSGEKLQNIADQYGVAFGTVYPIVMGKSYRHAPFPQNYSFGNRARKPLTQEDVADIRHMLSKGISQAKISQKHNVAQSIVSRINTGNRHVKK
jgi:hypothetical protein